MRLLFNIFFLAPLPLLLSMPAKAIAPPTGPEAAAKAQTELVAGQRYLRAGMWAEALPHCTEALGAVTSEEQATRCIQMARSGLAQERESAFRSRANLIESLIEHRDLAAAAAELKALRSFHQTAPAKFWPMGFGEESRLDELAVRLSTAKQQEWPLWIYPNYGVRSWLPGVVVQILRVLTYLVAAVLVVAVLYILRRFHRMLRWRRLDGPIHWSVSSISDETKQLAGGALMDALNIYHNPLFQELGTSSLLAAPPALTELGDPMDYAYSDPSSLVWRNFLVDNEGRGRVRAYLSDLIELIEIDKFARHTFKQVDAFEDITFKLGFIEAGIGSLVRNVQRWWTRGWPTVTGSVVIETVGAISFASIRLICNYGLRRDTQKQSLAPSDADVELGDLLADERTLAVFASTQIDEFSDAVALASHRAAFRLLYRLAKRPAEPNLAIAASSYRQGVRLLMSVI